MARDRPGTAPARQTDFFLLLRLTLRLPRSNFRFPHVYKIIDTRFVSPKALDVGTDTAKEPNGGLRALERLEKGWGT